MSLAFALVSLLCVSAPLPEARPDCGGVSFNFTRMSARRFSVPAPESDSCPFKVLSHFCDTLDGIFALSENQVGEMDFVFWSTNASAGAVSFRAELPPGVELVDTTFRPGLGSSSNPWWVVQHVLLAATRGPGGCGPGRLVVTCTNETGRFEVASKAIQFAILPEIRTARPRHYANGSFCGSAFGFSDRRSVERYARFLADAGVSWLIPSAADSYPALDIWRRNGFRIVTPYAGGWCANGYQLGDGKVPEPDRFVAVRALEPKYRDLQDSSVCPMSVIARSDYCREVVEPTIVRHLSGGVDGLWVNWEPFMYHGRGCGCERCGQAFAKWLGRPWSEIGPSWPSCAFRSGDFAWEGRRFRSWLHGQMIRRLDACVRTATGGEKSFGLIPGLHFEQMLSGWRKSDLMAESRPIDFADSFRWVNLWGPYLPWHAHLPYEEERGRYVGPWVVAHDLRGSIDRDYQAGRRPKVLSAPQGTAGDWLTEPENFEMLFDAAFFNGLEACAPWTFPSGADARYWRAFANATGRAAKYEDFVFGGEKADSAVMLRTVAEYASPVRRVLRNMPWVENVPQLLSNAYARDGIRIVAVFNCWQKGEAFVSLSCADLEPGRYEIVSDDGVQWVNSREKTTYDELELAGGVSLIVGAARCRVFEIRPAGASGPTEPRTILTAARVRRHYAERRAALRAAADEDRRFSETDTAGMIRYD